ncbi:MAG: glutamine--fructose-6-phosphate transaminase (isomerizing) [Alphaproteobacteria bacterium]
MCGIIGITGTDKTSVASDILQGLRRLEYRGYDSAGMAMLNNNQFHRLRSKGQLDNLIKQFSQNPIDGLLGIGHTRWATHGMATPENAHPHVSQRVALVHNGIIENYQELKHALDKKYQKQFTSETDTEVLVYILTSFLESGLSPEDAVKKMLPMLKGAFAFVVIFKHYPDTLIGVRRGSPLAIGYGKNGDEMFLGSDALSLSHLTDRVSFLEEGDWVILSPTHVIIYDKNNQQIERIIHQSLAEATLVNKGNYDHFMLKEIQEQPTVMAMLLQEMVNRESSSIILPKLNLPLKKIAQIQMAACGTAFYAGLTARHWAERLAEIPFQCDLASEIRYRQPPFLNNTLGLIISQSGETMDSLEAIRFFHKRHIPTLAIINVLQSTIAREAQATLFTHAGPEIGVASTKAFTSQLLTLLFFILQLAKEKNNKNFDKKIEQALVNHLLHLPLIMTKTLQHDHAAKMIADKLTKARSVLYLGRGRCYPLALEGALKLKEISYIHAEGYAAGEMKHGPMALIEEGMPIIAIIPYDELFEKNISNIQEVIARGGVIFALTDEKGKDELQKRKLAIKGFFTVPNHDVFLSPLVFSIPIQLIAYYTAVLKGQDVDKPRNLAKSVTVE